MIEADADGKPTNIEALLKNLLQLKPYMAGRPAVVGTGDPGTRGQPAKKTDMNQEIRRALGR